MSDETENNLSTRIEKLKETYGQFLHPDALNSFNSDIKSLSSDAEKQEITKFTNGELLKQAMIDKTSGLYNKAYIGNELPLEIEAAKRSNNPLGVLYIDVNLLKYVNDNFGHAKGDELIEKTADCLKSIFKRKNDLLARIGGDEFLVVLPLMNENELKNLYCQLKQAMRQYKIETSKEGVIPLSLAAGYDVFTPTPYQTHLDPEEIKTLIINNAEKNMYEDKNQMKQSDHFLKKHAR